MASWEKFSRIVAEAKTSKKLDPVGHEDADVNNDGVSDSSDSYLKKRRAAVGAAIDADKKKKVEEAKQLDPVGKEDEDIDNDGDSDRTDSYLRNRRKVRSKIIQREEVEQIDEFLGTGRVVAGKSQAGVNAGSRFTQAGTVQKVFGVTMPGSFKPGVSQSDVQRHNQKAAPNAQIKSTNQSMNQLLGRERGGQTTVGITPDKKPAPTAAAKPAAAAPKKTFADLGRETRSNIDKRNAALNDAMKQLRQSYEPEGDLVDEGKADKKLPEHKRSAARLARYDNPSGALALGGGQQRARRAEHEERRGVKKEEFVGEDKEYRREMAKAAARERAEEKKSEENYRAKGRTGKKKEGPKLSTTPITDKTAKSYVDKELGQIKYMDKKTKGKHLVGNPFPEHVEYEIEEGMSMKDFKSNRKKLQRKEASVDAEKRGHVGKEWHNTGRKYSPDEAKSRRSNMSDYERKQRYQTAEDPDNDNADDYPAAKTKDPKKLRKQKAMGEGYLQEKSLSRAQQRFFGMVRSEQEGKMKNASPEVKSAAQSMTKKQAHDFAATKHAGLPEKKEDVKEELSLVERIIAEATDAEWMAAKARREEREKKQSKRLKRAKLSAAANKILKGEDDEDQPKLKRGKSAPTGIERAATVTAAGRVKSAEKEGKYKVEAERMKSERQKERFTREDERTKQKALKEKELEKRKEEEEKKKAKQKRKSELKQDIKSAWNTGMKVGSGRKDTETAGALMSNVGSIASGVVKTGIAVGKYAWKKRQAKKEEERSKKQSEPQTQKEQFSNWREEFIFEVDDQTVQNEKQKLIDVSKKKNKIEINPNMSEECGCDEKKEKETPMKDMRELPTKVSLTKTKMRSAGVRNPIVMVASEENVQEFAALAPLVARLVGGTAARGIAGRIAGGAAQGSLRAKAAEFAGKKAGEVVSQSVQDKMTPQPQQPQQQGDEYWISNIGGKKVRNEDWQSVNRKDKTDGLSQKAVDAYRRENPGSKLQTAVTEKKPTGKRAERRKSFCSRMKGHKAKNTSAETARDPDSNINKALRRWNCN